MDPVQVPPIAMLQTSALAFALALAAPTWPQDGTENPFAAPKAQPILASDGKPSSPGRIPDDTTPEARERWLALSSRVTQASDPLHSFDLVFEVIINRQGGSNDLGKVRFAFDDAPTRGTPWLRSEFRKSDRVQVRGPRGDWLSEDGIDTSLAGRDNIRSREEMDEWVAIARNFMTIARLGSVRLVRIEAVDGPGTPLPRKDLTALAQGLTWVAVSSPDFRVGNSARGNAAPIYRAVFGYAPGGKDAAALVVLTEEDSRTTVVESARLIRLEDWRGFDGQLLPQGMRVFAVDLNAQPWGFQHTPVANMWLLPNGARIDPELGEELFLPGGR